MLHVTTITNSAVRGARNVWFEPGSDDGPCYVFLDAELFIDRVHAPEIIRRHAEANRLPSPTCVYLSFGEAVDRHIDFACNEAFTDFLARELSPWVRDLLGGPTVVVLCGLSLSGLAAAFAARRYPSIFPRILCQSPSAWWNEEWLTTQWACGDRAATRCWISVGDQETTEHAIHEPTQMVQRSSQVASCHRLAEAMTNAGATVNENLFSGGHDPACWAAELASALHWLTTDD